MKYLKVEVITLQKNSTLSNKYAGYSHIYHYFLGFPPLNTLAPLSRGGKPVCWVKMRPGLACTFSAADVPESDVEFFLRALV
jgi:hypothetical protein